MLQSCCMMVESAKASGFGARRSLSGPMPYGSQPLRILGSGRGPGCFALKGAPTASTNATALDPLSGRLPYSCRQTSPMCRPRHNTALM